MWYCLAEFIDGATVGVTILQLSHCKRDPFYTGADVWADGGGGRGDVGVIDTYDGDGPVSLLVENNLRRWNISCMFILSVGALVIMHALYSSGSGNEYRRG